MNNLCETTLRVRYAETDQMGVAYHANHYIWFEVGRVEFIRQLGYSYKDMEREHDCFIVVVESKCRYRRPARYDDVLRIRTWVSEGTTRTIRFQYEIVNDATGESVATGETLHVVCDRLGRPKSLPDLYRRIFSVLAPPEMQAARANQTHK
jgi:acyl-CoA thioester hydrolase